jgi:pimeloyl-ACP methyl ester carboxylesterase
MLAPEPDAPGEHSDPPHWTLRDLRRFGQQANARRYGRGDIVPVGLLDFSESSNGYSTLNAVWMSEMSALAYWDSVVMEKQLRQWGYKLIAVIMDAHTDTNGYLAAKDNHLVLSFRGTSSLKNFNTDAQILKIPAMWAEGNIHPGFAGALAAVWPQITEHLGLPGQQQKELWVTGHSLGAALAQLAALHLTKLGYRVRAVYTFGTPRVGDSGFVGDYDKLLGERTFPHINDKDVVTRVPPFSLGFRATASKQIRQFAGAGHETIPFQETPDGPETASNWRNGAIDSIRNTTEFLPAFLRPKSLQVMPAEVRPISLYSATFQQGALDEHGSFECLFKLVCEALEQDLWPIEAKQANAGRVTIHHD